MFLDSTESSLSLEFYKMKCSAKPWAEHWAGSQTVEEMVHFGFRNLYFQNQLVFEMLWATYGLSRELCVGCFVWYLQNLDFLDSV